MASQWQKVGKDGRGVRKESAKKKRKQDHSFNPVVVEPAKPIRESETKFSAISKGQNLDDSGLSEDESLPPPLSKPRAKPAVKMVDKQEKKEEWKLDDLSPIDVLQQSWLRDLGQHFMSEEILSLLEVARKQPLDEVAHFKDLVKFVTAPVPKQLVSEYRSIVRHALESVMTVCITHTHPIPRSSIFHEGYVHLADHYGDEEEKHLKRLVSRLVVVCDACREEWMELHEDFLKQSLILLNELLRNSPKVKPLGPLLQRIKDDLPRLKEKETDISLCRRYVDELMDKCGAEGDSDEEMEEGGGGVEPRPRFQWMNFLWKLLIILFFLVIVDIGWSQGWAGSLTCTGLAAVGVRIPLITVDPLFSYITRMLEDIGVSKNLLNIWLDTIYFLQTVWGFVLDYFFLAGRMYKDLFYITKHCLWDHLKQLSLQDYINHIIKPN